MAGSGARAVRVPGLILSADPECFFNRHALVCPPGHEEVTAMLKFIHGILPLLLKTVELCVYPYESTSDHYTDDSIEFLDVSLHEDKFSSLFFPLSIHQPIAVLKLSLSIATAVANSPLICRSADPVCSTSKSLLSRTLST